MPIISSVKPQKNQKRVNIYLDQKFGFGIDLENFVKSGLKVGQELTNKEIADLINKSEYQKTLDKLLKFAMLRPRSEREINIWYMRKKVHESLQKKLYKKLKGLELLDDAKFAHWWIDQRLSFKPRGKRLLYTELVQKGISKNIIEETFEKIKINELKMARKILSKRMYRLKNLKTQSARKKAGEFLARKGFSWETISVIVNELFEIDLS